jgi:hypothetical protein
MSCVHVSATTWESPLDAPGWQPIGDLAQERLGRRVAAAQGEERFFTHGRLSFSRFPRVYRQRNLARLRTVFPPGVVLAIARRQSPVG